MQVRGEDAHCGSVAAPIANPAPPSPPPIAPTPTAPVWQVWGSWGAAPGQFQHPFGVAVDGQGDVYVADWRNDRVQKLSTGG